MLTVNKLEGTATGFDPKIGKITVSFNYRALNDIEITKVDYDFNNSDFSKLEQSEIIDSCKSVIQYCIDTNDFNNI